MDKETLKQQLSELVEMGDKDNIIRGVQQYKNHFGQDPWIDEFVSDYVDHIAWSSHYRRRFLKHE